jgi:hypothetical protein
LGVADRPFFFLNFPVNLQGCEFAGCTGGGCEFKGSCGSSCTFGQCLGGDCTGGGWAGGTASDVPMPTAVSMGIGIVILLIFVSLVSIVGCIVCLVCCLKQSRQPPAGFVPIGTVATVNAAYVPPPSGTVFAVQAQTYTPVHVAAQASTPQAAPAPMQAAPAPMQATTPMPAPNSGSAGGPGSATFVSAVKAPLKMPEV